MGYSPFPALPVASTGGGGGGGAATLNDLLDVSGAPSDRDVLTFTGANWQPRSAPIGGFVIPVASADAPEYQREWANNVGALLGIGDLACDGTADNVQIQAALDAAQDLVVTGYGARVELSAGRFYLGANGSVVHHPRVSCEGQGVGSTIIQPTDPDDWTETTINGFSAGTPMWDAFVDDPNNAAGGTSQLSHLTLYGGGMESTGHVSGLRVYTNDNNSSGQPVVGPDSFHQFHHIGVGEVSSIGVWVPGSASTGGTSSLDTQACHFHDIRVYRTGWHGFIMGGADNFFEAIDVGSTGNKSTLNRVSYGIWVDGGNHHIWNCKSWYAKRAGVAGTSLSGVGWYINNTRIIAHHLEAQENRNHGFYFQNLRGTAHGLMAHSNGTNGVNGNTGDGLGRDTDDCAGIYLGPNPSNFVLTGYVFNQAPGSRNGQAYGVYNEGSCPNSFIQVAFYSQSTSGTPAPVNRAGTTFAATCKYWIGGDSNSSQTTVENLTGVNVPVVKQRTSTNTVTGTTLTADSSLTATIAGGTARWYEYEAHVEFNGDPTTDAKIGVRLTPSGSSSTTELHSEFRYTNTSAAPTRAFDMETQTGTGTLTHSVDDAECAGATGVANRRLVSIKGVAYVGTNVTTATLAVVYAEAGGTGTGVAVTAPSYLKVTPMNLGTVT